MPRTAGLAHVSLTVTDLGRAVAFWHGVLELEVIVRTDTYCAFRTGSAHAPALFVTVHDTHVGGLFDDFRVGLDHVCLRVDSEAELDVWRDHLADHGVQHTYERSEWGHHVRLHDPDNIAVELFVLEPDEESAGVTPGGA